MASCSGSMASATAELAEGHSLPAHLPDATLQEHQANVF
jgi:hypothetical protein